MANDYIPRPHARFHAYRNNLVTYVTDHPADSGLEAARASSAPLPACEEGRDACYEETI